MTTPDLSELAAAVREAGAAAPLVLPLSDRDLGRALYVVDKLAAYYGEHRQLGPAYGERERDEWLRLPETRRKAWTERGRRLRLELAEQIVDAEIVDGLL